VLHSAGPSARRSTQAPAHGHACGAHTRTVPTGTVPSALETSATGPRR
jgi:hypothetical protein